MEGEDRESDLLFGEGENVAGRRSPQSDHFLDNLNNFHRSFNDPMKSDMLPDNSSEDPIEMNLGELPMLQNPTDDQMDLPGVESYDFSNNLKNDHNNKVKLDGSFKVLNKTESNNKQNYELRKRDPNTNLSENELMNKSMRDAYNERNRNVGYGMIITPDTNFIMTKPVCLIGRKPCSEQVEKDWACALTLTNQETNKSISRVSAKIFYSSKLGEYWIENVGKNSILVDRRSLSPSTKGKVIFRPLRNEAWIQISSLTLFFILPKELLQKKKILRENRKSLLFEKVSKLCQKPTGTKDWKDEQIITIKESSSEIFQDTPYLSLKDLILLYKNNQFGVELPQSLEDKYFLKGKKAGKGYHNESVLGKSDAYSHKYDF